MKKLLKILSLIVIMIFMVTLSVQAYTNEDVISYVTKPHTVNGRTVQLSSGQRESLTQYLRNNAVTESEANDIIGKLDKAKSLIDNSGATNLAQLSESIKGEVISLVKEAGRIADLDVQVDTKNETVTIKDLKGNTVISATSYSQFNGNPQTTAGTSASNSGTSTTSKGSSSKLVYTGNNYKVELQAVIAIVAVAIAGILVKNKYAE